VLGPSGSGKSTALRLIAGLEEPTEGRIRIGGRDMIGVDAPQRGVAMVFQTFALFPHMDVARNIGFGLEARGLPEREVNRQVREAAASVGIGDLLGRRPAELSGGERQRAALARSLTRKPSVLLMDEPLSNLDAPLRADIRAEIRRIHAETGITIVYVTHDQAEALSLGDRVAMLEGGVLQQQGTPREVYDRPINIFVAGFLGSPPMNLVPATAEADSVVGSGFHLPLPRGTAVARGAEVIAGFRPEVLKVAGPDGDPAFTATLEGEETIGHDRVWYLRAEAERLAMRPQDGDRAHEGNVVRVRVAAEDVRLFDPQTGAAL
jgi:ABC-type sugar transport system ATPase subunit